MDENIEDLFAFYALQALSEAERLKVEDFIASNPEAKVRLDQSIQAVAALPHGTGPVNPPPAVKEELMQRVRADAQVRFGSNNRSHSRGFQFPSLGRWLPQALAVFSLLLATGLGVWAISLNQEISHLKTQVALLEQEVQTTGSVLAHLTSPLARAFAIAGTPQQPEAHGQLIANPGSGSSVLVVSGLKPLESGRTYEFWLIKDNAAVPAGLFKVDDQGRAILQVAQAVSPQAYNAIGVSIEPEGGSQQPGPDIIMLGKVD
jgi:anti-sigma-K factor RskA